VNGISILKSEALLLFIKEGGGAFKMRWKAMKPEKLVNSGIPILCGVLLLLITSFTFIQIVLREFFNFSFNWTDEVSQFCMMWLALFGSIWLNKHERHLNTGLKLHRKLNQKLVCLIDCILALAIVGFAAVAAYQGAIYVFMTLNQASLSLDWLKMGYVFIAVPIFMVVACYYYLKSFFKNVKQIFKKE
jgi:TRAP-type C4-dicarboxylate transport system permease small subunit